MLSPMELGWAQETWRYGHGPYDVAYKDLGKLTIDDPRLKAAFASRGASQGYDLARATAKAHGAEPTFDGIVGPANNVMLSKPRCSVPDHALPADAISQLDGDDAVVAASVPAEPATGTGPWEGCHGVGDFHAVAVGIDMRNRPSFLTDEIFNTILTNVQREYAKFGLLVIFVVDGRDYLTGEAFEGRINTHMSFVRSSSGWIGLAIVGQNETCSSQPIWLRLLATYKPAALVANWTTLIMHELGHNLGFGHSNGGVMNPSLVNNLGEWRKSDPLYSRLVRMFGGVPVGGKRPPKEPDDVASRLKELGNRTRSLELQTAIHAAMLEEVLHR